MKTMIVLLVFIILFWGCLFKKDRDISSLIPKLQQVKNALIQINFYEPSFQINGYLYFQFDLQNLTNQTLTLQVNDGQLITPINNIYKRFDKAEAIAAIDGSFGYTVMSRQTGEKIHINSEEYTREHLLQSMTIPQHKSVRSMIVFPYPTELQGPTEIAFRGVYRIVIDGWTKDEKQQLPFPELTWNADSSRVRWLRLAKRMKK